ncbi:PH domain-containing protein [Catellatospora sp. NPDC049609]|uniref:PH domain-containing protein n=1 Tax=Catellatospora sp. NPDC049609 TaxID=3155505 RepID=UPI003413F00D
MSSTAVPAEPAVDDLLSALASQNRRLLLAAWAVGGAGLALCAGLAGQPGWSWRLVAAGTALATLFAYLGVAHLLWRVRRPAALAPVTMPQGFTALGSPVAYARGVPALAGAGLALGVGQRITALLLLLLAALLIHLQPRLLVTPGGVTVRRVLSRSLPWAHLTGVRVTSRGGIAELSLATAVPNRPAGTVRLALPSLDVDRAFLVHLLLHYLAVPEDRTAIGAPAELSRRRATFPRPAVDRPADELAELLGEDEPLLTEGEAHQGDLASLLGEAHRGADGSLPDKGEPPLREGVSLRVDEDGLR